MISAFTNSMKIPELRQRIFFTLAIIVIVRFGAAITLPGVDATVLQNFLADRLDMENDTAGAAGVGAMLNIFSGGALLNCAIFALGIMPYISAAIMMQLLTAVVPRLNKISREDGGRQKINQYTRWATVVLALAQGIFLAISLTKPETNPFLRGLDEVAHGVLVPNPDWVYYLSAITTIVAGTTFLMWLGEQITERGIGNGISLIIAVNIVSELPTAIMQLQNQYLDRDSTYGPAGAVILVVLIAMMALVTAGVIAITQAQRRIPVQYAKRVVGRKVYGGQKNYMPLKVNYSGVMPIIFAQAILLFPTQLVSWISPEGTVAQTIMEWFGNPERIHYYIISSILIFFFSYFWVATMFQPSQIADDLKKNGAYIPGVRPGKPTAEFLDHTMSRLTFAGALFLTLIYALPMIASVQLGVPFSAAQLFGGTSILILVGVLLDMMRQVETHLIQRHYDGFLRKGKIRGRSERPTRAGATSTLSSGNTMLWLYVFIAVLIITGMVAWLNR